MGSFKQVLKRKKQVINRVVLKGPKNQKTSPE